MRAIKRPLLDKIYWPGGVLVIFGCLSWLTKLCCVCHHLSHGLLFDVVVAIWGGRNLVWGQQFVVPLGQAQGHFGSISVCAKLVALFFRCSV